MTRTPSDPLEHRFQSLAPCVADIPASLPDHIGVCGFELPAESVANGTARPVAVVCNDLAHCTSNSPVCTHHRVCYTLHQATIGVRGALSMGFQSHDHATDSIGCIGTNWMLWLCTGLYACI